MTIISKKQKKKSGKIISCNNNAINYVHWHDPNELVDRAGNNAHDTMLSIIDNFAKSVLL